MDAKLIKIILLNIAVTVLTVVTTHLVMKKLSSPSEMVVAEEVKPIEEIPPAKTGDVSGVYKMTADIQTLEIKFNSGYMRIDYNGSAGEVNWDCDGEGTQLQIHSDAKKAKGVLNFSAPYLDCDITVPAKPFTVHGGAGKIEVRQIQSPIQIELLKGTVYLDPIPDKAYIYQINAEKAESEDAPPGDVDRLEGNSPFVSSNQADAIAVKVIVKRGAIVPLSEAEDIE